MDPSEINHYLQLARSAARHAHNPYSRFTVGCVLVDTQRGVHTGCNIESASYAATLCAERVAASGAIARGIRTWNSLFLVSPTRVSPCGICRQFLVEFAPDLPIYLGFLEVRSIHETETVGPLLLSELLPWAGELQRSPIGRKE
jgi:cytidine deaminase